MLAIIVAMCIRHEDKMRLFLDYMLAPCCQGEKRGFD